MKLAADIIITFIILFWPGLVMMSPMVFDAPGSENSKAKILSVLGMFFCPSLIFLGYVIFGASFYTFSSLHMFLISLAVAIGAFIFLGYPKFMLDGWRGVSS